VSTPTTPIQTQSALGQELIDKAVTLWTEAAKQSDSAEGLGIDGRIALVHALVDLWAKGWAAAIQAVIKAPALWPGTPESTNPLPSEVVDVKSATTYPRQIEAVGPFTRVGLPAVTIPPWAIGFEPSFLPAGLTQFRIILKDYRYIGANYTGTIKLSTQSLANIAPDERVVVVGL
jgi:hypothetical protein